MPQQSFGLKDILKGFGIEIPEMPTPSKEEDWTPSEQERHEKAQRQQKKMKTAFFILIVPVILGAYWWFHPALNIQNPDLWVFVSIFVLLPSYVLLKSRSQTYKAGSKKLKASQQKSVLFSRLALIPVAVVAIGLIGGLASSVVYPGNARRYAAVLPTINSNFSEDIKEVEYDKIPIIDRNSAALLGNRVMGGIPEYVSQFEISDLYSQINYKGHPVRVSPLNYADIIKWFNNRSEGLPAFVLIDMTTQDAQIVRLTQKMKYATSEPLGRNINRHVQLSFPFYLFDEFAFEIDEEGNPWWVCPVQKRTIGLFGGKTIVRVVLCNAATGQCYDYAVEDCPTWVDKVYPADLLITQYNWFGAYRQGWINSWLGQEGVVQTTPGTNGMQGYNYIAKDDDVWVYSGVTSAVSDNSIVGFILVNQRTAESHYYAIAGATEESAMRSAQGQVQHLGYEATFPLLLNINAQPTYFMALKDKAGLVKMYAMLDIQRYQNVAVGATLQECQANYKELLRINGVDVPEETKPAAHETSGKVERITPVVVNGNTHFYLILENDKAVYDCPLPNLLDVLRLEVGDSVTLTYREVDGLRVVEKMTIRPAPKVSTPAGGSTAPAS